MISALLFLISRSFLNRTRARFKRLKQPKYFVGALLGLLYFYGYFFQFLFRPQMRPEGGTGFEEIIAGIGSLVLLVLVVSAWIFPHQRAALVFTEAEIAFLFPAPVHRRSLIHYKLLKSQMAILFTVLILTLVTGRIFTSSEAWMRVVGWWVILSTLNLHFLGASFTRTLLLDRGYSNAARRIAVISVVLAIAGLTVWWARQNTGPTMPGAAASGEAWKDYAVQLLGMPPLGWVLAPFRCVVAPYLATSPGEFVTAFGIALGIMTLHYVWVMQANVAFEEASVLLSQRMAERIAAVRAGKGMDITPAKAIRAPFVLTPHGLPPVALLWKNLISVQSTVRLKTLFIVLLPVLAVAISSSLSDHRGSVFVGTLTMLTFMGYIWSLLLGAQLVRCDFRRDLPLMDVLKTFPLRGWQMVAGELLAPAVILSLIQWALLLVLGLIVTLSEPLHLPKVPLGWLGAAALVTPFWNALVLLIPNAAVLTFPAWFQTRADAPQGFEVAGQRLLLLLGQMLVFAIALIPATLAFLIGFLPMQALGWNLLAPFTGAIGAAVALAAETALGVWLVGKLFDRFDLADE
jgi:ABC-2 type transport system permease protein